MIRAAALLLALTAGAAAAQVKPGAELVAACGGLQVVVEVPSGTAVETAEVLNLRAGPLPGLIRYATAGDGSVTVEVPGAFATSEMLMRLTARGDLSLWSVSRRGDGTPPEGALPEGDFGGWVLLDTPIIENGGVAGAEPMIDQNGQPGLSFRMTAEAGRTFGTWTTENVGAPLAIVYDGTVLSTPVVMTPILGGSGMITGNFTVAETQAMADVIDAGALPVDVTVLSVNEVARPVDAPEDLCGPDLGN